MRRLVSDWILKTEHFCFLCHCLQALVHGMEMSISTTGNIGCKKTSREVAGDCSKKRSTDAVSSKYLHIQYLPSFALLIDIDPIS